MIARVQLNEAADLGIGYGDSLQSSVETTVSSELPNIQKKWVHH